MRFMMFTKHLQPLLLTEAGLAIKDIGFDGADLTVRDGGYVDPTRVRDELPRAIATLKDCGLETPLLTTNITRASDPVATPTFESAAACGTREIKLGYWKYNTFGTFVSTLDQVKRDLDGIEQLAHRTGVRANLHVHSENFITAQAPIIWNLIKDRDPKCIGAYVDPGHMCIEGGGDGWRMGLDLLSSRISLVAVKDADWASVRDDALGKPRWYTRMVPLREGIVPWPSVFACLKQIGFDGWVSVHSEYQGGHSWKDLATEEVIAQTRLDVAYLKDEVLPRAATASTNAISRRGPSNLRS